MGSSHFTADGIHWMRFSARALALLWAGWWTYFGVASGIGEKLSPVGVLIHTAMPGLIFLVSVAIAWRWEMAGGILLVLEGIWAIRFFRPKSAEALVFMLLTIALPPVIAGVLFLVSGWRSR